MYKQYNNPITGKADEFGIIRITDNVCIPFDPDNVDYQAYLAWVAEGNTPTPADKVAQ